MGRGRNVFFADVQSKRICQDWILEIDCRFGKFDQWPLGEVSGQSIAILMTSGKTNDRYARDSIFRELSTRKRGSYKKMIMGRALCCD